MNPLGKYSLATAPNQQLMQLISGSQMKPENDTRDFCRDFHLPVILSVEWYQLGGLIIGIVSSVVSVGWFTVRYSSVASVGWFLVRSSSVASVGWISLSVSVQWNHLIARMQSVGWKWIILWHLHQLGGSGRLAIGTPRWRTTRTCNVPLGKLDPERGPSG